MWCLMEVAAQYRFIRISIICSKIITAFILKQTPLKACDKFNRRHSSYFTEQKYSNGFKKANFLVKLL